MRIFFVRHAESRLGATDRHQRARTGLSRRGKEQASSVARRLSGVKFSLIVSSRHQRAMQTARAIGDASNKRIVYTRLLNELKRPSEVEGRSRADQRVVRIKDEIWRHRDDPEWHYSDEENMHDFKRRVSLGLDYLLGSRRKSIVVVTHGGVMSMLIGLLAFGKGFDPVAEWHIPNSFHMENTGISEFELEKGGRWKLITWNDFCHLK